MTLSTLIVQRGLATFRELEEALARQVLYGGDLVTNLLEVRELDEALLMEVLVESTGVPPAPVGPLPFSDTEVLYLIAPETANDRNFVPLAVEHGALVIVVAEPLSRESLRELSFALSLPVAMRVAPHVRVRQALHHAYGIALDARVERLVARIEGRGEKRPTSVPAPNLPAFVRLPRPPSDLPSVRTPIEPQLPVTVPPPVARPSTKPTEAPPPERQELAIVTPIEVIAPPEHVPSTNAHATFVHERATTPKRPERRRRGPLTADVAKKELSKAVERDAIFDIVFEFARQFFDYAAFFTVHADVAEGRDAHGEGASRAQVGRLGVPLDLPNLLSMARTQKTVLVKVPSAQGLDAGLMNDLGRDGRTECAVIPVVVRSRVVALVLGDGGDDGIDATSLTEVTKVASYATAAFERLLVQRKQGGITASPRIASEDSPSGRITVAPPAAPILPEAVPPPEMDAGEGTPVSVPLDVDAHTSDPPPPPQLLAVKTPSDPPIPREEPDTEPTTGSSGEPPIEEAPRSRLGRRRGEAPVLEFSPTAEVAEAEQAAGGARPHLPPVSPGAPASPARMMPVSEQQVSVAPHRPPIPRTESRELPSIIVDVIPEYAAFVDRILANGGGDDEELALLRGGRHAMPAIMKHFPGPVKADLDPRSTDTWPRPSECGPILRLVARQRRTALPFVLGHVEDVDTEKRFWATFLLTELAYIEAIEPAFHRLFDEEARVRRAAKAAIVALSDTHPRAMVERLENVAHFEGAPVWRRLVAIEALSATREPLSAGALVPLLRASDREIVTVARQALVRLTRQDFGDSSGRWESWWRQNEGRHRIEWLIDALVHDQTAIRAAASEELKMLTKEYFGYDDDLPKRERERVQARYREWWLNTGRVRFHRDDMRLR